MYPKLSGGFAFLVCVVLDQAFVRLKKYWTRARLITLALISRYRICRWRPPVRFCDHLGLSRIVNVMRRHDLHAVAVESVLNRGVQMTQHLGA